MKIYINGELDRLNTFIRELLTREATNRIRANSSIKLLPAKLIFFAFIKFLFAHNIPFDNVLHEIVHI